MLTHRNLVANVLQVEAPEFAFYSRENARAAEGRYLCSTSTPSPCVLARFLRHGHTFVTMKRFDLSAG